jgi:hypothetical protein
VRLRHPLRDRTASSLRVVGIKATSARRARYYSQDIRAWRGLDVADRTRRHMHVAAPEIVAEHGLTRNRAEHTAHPAARNRNCSPAVAQRGQGRAPRATRGVPLTAHLQATGTIEKFAHPARLTTRSPVIRFEEAP